MYYQKLSCIYRFLPWNELHLTCHIAFCLTNKNDLLVETRRSESVYSSEHPIFIIVWAHIWLTSYPARTSMNFANLERTEKTRKQWHGCHVLLIFVKTLFTFDDWYPFRLRGVHLSRNSRNCKSRIMRLQNSKSRITLCCPVARHADNWVQSRVTLQILEPSRVTQILFSTLLILLFGPTQSHLTSFFFAWSRLLIARASGTERTTVIRLKDDRYWRGKRAWAPVLSERSSNSVSVVRVIDQLFKCFKAIDWFSDTHLSDFFHF